MRVTGVPCERFLLNGVVGRMGGIALPLTHHTSIILSNKANSPQRCHPERSRFSGGAKDLLLPFASASNTKGAPSIAQLYRAMGGIAKTLLQNISEHPAHLLRPNQ
jgi:hypothetical protein